MVLGNKFHLKFVCCSQDLPQSNRSSVLCFVGRKKMLQNKEFYCDILIYLFHVTLCLFSEDLTTVQCTVAESIMDPKSLPGEVLAVFKCADSEHLRII